MKISPDAKQEKEKVAIRYPYDDHLPTMIDESIDNFIQRVAAHKA